MSNDNRPVIIIGAGLAGLCCALRLHKDGVPFLLLEASDAVGGRVRTDSLNGFTLDRGFQIFLNSYPEAANVLDYKELDLRPFFPGALVRSGGKFHHVADPVRSPLHAVETLLAPVGTMTDKFRVAALRSRRKAESPEAATNHSESTLQTLRKTGFSDRMIQQFFRPFLGGIFLDETLETNSKMFDFVFSMLANGDNSLPSRGMQCIPEQLASRLPKEQIRLNTSVRTIDGDQVLLSTGTIVRGSTVVVATEEPQRHSLLGSSLSPRFKSQTCVYFEAERPPFVEPILVLNGENDGIVSNLTVPSNVSSSYAPKGRVLISAVVIGDAPMSDLALEEAARMHMTRWYGTQVSKWRHLRTYRIKYALPDQSPQALNLTKSEYKGEKAIYFCGDYLENASINGALKSGRKAAEMVLADLKSTAI